MTHRQNKSLTLEQLYELIKLESDISKLALDLLLKSNSQEVLYEDSSSLDTIHIMRETVRQGLGFNCTFVDDDMNVLVGLAQRAVLAGLDADAQPDMKRRFRKAAEKHRERHEKLLGFKINYAAKIPSI